MSAMFIVLSPKVSDEVVLHYFRGGFDIIINRPLTTDTESARAPQVDEECLQDDLWEHMQQKYAGAISPAMVRDIVAYLSPYLRTPVSNENAENCNLERVQVTKVDNSVTKPDKTATIEKMARAMDAKFDKWEYDLLGSINSNILATAAYEAEHE